MALQAQFPDHDLPVRSKGDKWCAQYMKAAYSENNLAGYNYFFGNEHKYETVKSYAQGNQSIGQYKPLMGVDENDTESHLNIDWTIVPIGPKFRRIALNKISKYDFNIVATPTDILATNETNEHFARMKSKIEIREMAKEKAPQLLETEALRMQQGDPETTEELEVQREYTYQHQAAIEMQDGINLLLSQNKYRHLRKEIHEDLFDYGVAGVKEYKDGLGNIKIRRLDTRSVVISPCKQRDFRDKRYIGEVLDLTINELRELSAGQIDEKTLKDIATMHLGKLGNPRSMPEATIHNRGYDSFKVQLLDLEWYSHNKVVAEKRIDKRGNEITRVVESDAARSSKNEYISRDVQVVYQGCWVVGTDHVFDCKVKTDARKKFKKGIDREMSYHLFAPDFHDMRIVGMMEQITPTLDQIQVGYYHLQQAVAEARPRGVYIDYTALENMTVGGEGGDKWDPEDILDLFYKRGVLVYRRVDINGDMTNYKPIEELQNGIGDEAERWFRHIQNHIQTLRDILGMNEFTDGSTPDPKSLSTPAKLAAEGTNNSLNYVVDGERRLLEDLSESLAIHLFDAVSEGRQIKGYATALGEGTKRFLEATSTITPHEFGIEISDVPTVQDRERLLARAEKLAGEGILDMEDLAIIENTKNLKVAQQILAWRVKRKRKEMREEKKELAEHNAMVQTRATQESEAAKQATIQLEEKLRMAREMALKEKDEVIEKMKKEYDLKIAQLKEGYSTARTALSSETQENIEASKQAGAREKAAAGAGQNPQQQGQPQGKPQGQPQGQQQMAPPQQGQQQMQPPAE